MGWTKEVSCQPPGVGVTLAISGATPILSVLRAPGWFPGSLDDEEEEGRALEASLAHPGGALHLDAKKLCMCLLYYGKSQKFSKRVEVLRQKSKSAPFVGGPGGGLPDV